MANPFDQFDNANGNPFDEFDEAQPNSAPAKTTPIPLSPHELQQGRIASSGIGGIPIMDEVSGALAGVSSLLKGRGFMPAYEAERDKFRNAASNYQNENPWSAAGMSAVGSLPLLLVGGGTQAAATLPGRMAQGATAGGAYGAASGFAGGEGGAGNRALNAVEVGIPSAVLGGVTPAVAEGALGAGKWIGGKLRGGDAPPTAEALKTAARGAYAKAENAGVIIDKNSFKSAVSDIQKELAEEGIDATLHPKALAAFKRLEAVDDHLTLKGAEQLRRVVQGAAKSIEPDERRMASIIRDKLDDYMSGLESKDLVGGDAAKATEALKEARGLWSKASKGELLDDLVERAQTRASQFSGSGYENAIRTEFRQLAMNEKRMRRFSADEREAIQAVVKGGPVGNALRLLGKLAPTGVVSGGIGAGAGYLAGGPAGAALIPAAGLVGRQGATMATERNARLASELVRRGGPAPVKPFAPAQIEGLDPTLIGMMEALGLDRLLLAPTRQQAP